MDNNNFLDENKLEDKPVVSEMPAPEEGTAKVADAQPAKKTIKINLCTIIIVVIVIAVLVLAYIFKGLFIAATVDGSLISRLTVVERLEKISGQSILDSLINQKLVSAAARAQNIEITAEEIAEEIKNLEDQFAAQGSTLDEVLEMQNMTRADLEEEIIFQKQLEQLVTDKITVTDEEVADYISTYELEIPEDQQELANEQIRNELKNQKINQEVDALINNLKEDADIKYFVKY